MTRRPVVSRKIARSWTAEAVLRFGDLLSVYHRHRLQGVRHLRAALRTGRPVLLVGNHCMDVADPLMLRAAVDRETGRSERSSQSDRSSRDAQSSGV